MTIVLSAQMKSPLAPSSPQLTQEHRDLDAAIEALSHAQAIPTFWRCRG